jgi:hypothetical protein
MNDDDELRARLARLDPLHGDPSDRGPVRSHDDPAGRQQLEHIMDTTSLSDAGRPPRRSLALLGVAAAIIAVAVIGVVALTGDDNGDADVAALELTAGESDVMASCIAIDATILADMPVAFRGTVTAVEQDVVTLEVDRWYRGGDAEAVKITAPAGLGALIGEIDFVAGNQYLISATDGTVNYCGFSGAVTPELQAIYDEAFPG